ncbi:hypothetical protein BCU71_25405 [Vibrio lentus]|nr:hypothetical protein BCU71_25405 [Vibrio lentus]
MEFQLINILREWGLTPQIVILAWLMWSNLNTLKSNLAQTTELLSGLNNRVTVLEVKKDEHSN